MTPANSDGTKRSPSTAGENFCHVASIVLFLVDEESRKDVRLVVASLLLSSFRFDCVDAMYSETLCLV